MNSSTRYILTATVVAGGLFFVGATANAIVNRGEAADETIGEAVVVPTAAASDETNADDETTEVVDPSVAVVPSPSPEPSPEPKPEKPKPTKTHSTQTWTTTTGSGHGDDDDDDHDKSSHEDEHDDEFDD